MIKKVQIIMQELIYGVVKKIKIFLFIIMETVDVVLITTISNMILQPLLQYFLMSKCSKIRACGGCIEIEREINKKEIVNKELENNDINI
jgi:antibiotic biosynthesis monooxygenase (ABM) superfamily enzyme